VWGDSVAAGFSVVWGDSVNLAFLLQGTASGNSDK
jgi:class 3 adenylate cyclase